MRYFTWVVFIYLLCPIKLQILKKILTVDPEIKACIILGHKYPFGLNEDFSGNLLN